jgi:thiol-disulfide isomerase/thioredoxin
MSSEYFYASCPVCSEVNGTSSQSYWKHKGCGGYSKVNSWGELWCEYCPSSRREFVDWLFECENHRPKEVNDVFKIRYIFGVIADAQENKRNQTFWMDLAENVAKQIRNRKGI